MQTFWAGFSGGVAVVVGIVVYVKLEDAYKAWRTDKSLPTLKGR